MKICVWMTWTFRFVLIAGIRCVSQLKNFLANLCLITGWTLKAHQMNGTAALSRISCNITQITTDTAQNTHIFSGQHYKRKPTVQFHKYKYEVHLFKSQTYLHTRVCPGSSGCCRYWWPQALYNMHTASSLRKYNQSQETRTSEGRKLSLYDTAQKINIIHTGIAFLFFKSTLLWILEGAGNARHITWTTCNTSVTSGWKYTQTHTHTLNSQHRSGDERK